MKRLATMQLVDERGQQYVWHEDPESNDHKLVKYALKDCGINLIEPQDLDNPTELWWVCFTAAVPGQVEEGAAWFEDLKCTDPARFVTIIVDAEKSP